MVEPTIMDCKMISLIEIISNNRDIFTREDITNIYDILMPPSDCCAIDITFDIEDCDEDDEEYNHGYYQLVQIIKNSSWYSPDDKIFLDMNT